MNLGILKVAAVLERRQIPVEVLDLSGIRNFEAVVSAHAAQTDATIFGLTATTPQWPACTKISHALSEARPGARTILGGPHITLVNAALKREQKLGVTGRASRHYRQAADLFSVLVAGDGETAIESALTTTGKLIDVDDFNSPGFMSDADFEDSPWPARHLIDISSYHYLIDGEPALSLVAQLGCPFACGFCAGRTSSMLRRIRLRSAESVVAEMAYLHRTYGTKGFMLYDDELNVNKGMIELMDKIADLQFSLGVSFKLRGCIKAELFTDEQAAAMKRAGFSYILVGFESGDPRILKNINKKATRADNTRCVEIARRHGLKVKALMSIGHPGESRETARAARDWLLEAQPDEFNCTVITATPGTFYYDHAVQVLPDANVWTYTCASGDRLHSIDLDYAVVSNYYNGAPHSYQSFVFTDFMSSADLVECRDEIEETVRGHLKIPFNQSAASLFYDQSMGQSGGLPGYILRASTGPVCEPV